jgi:hypothetical protein
VGELLASPTLPSHPVVVRGVAARVFDCYRPDWTPPSHSYRCRPTAVLLVDPRHPSQAADEALPVDAGSTDPRRRQILVMDVPPRADSGTRTSITPGATYLFSGRARRLPNGSTAVIYAGHEVARIP